jgi:hypothetical protein
MARATPTGQAPLFCSRCATPLEPGAGNFFVVRIEAFADPTPPAAAEIDPADLRREIERLVDRMRGLSEQELMDQIYRRLVISMCTPCFRLWIEDPARPA